MDYRVLVSSPSAYEISVVWSPSRAVCPRRKEKGRLSLKEKKKKNKNVATHRNKQTAARKIYYLGPSCSVQNSTVVKKLLSTGTSGSRLFFLCVIFLWCDDRRTGRLIYRRTDKTAACGTRRVIRETRALSGSLLRPGPNAAG